MRILILGKNHSAYAFFKNFEKNKEDIVFSTIENCNYIELKTKVDVIDFVEANEINFVLITDEKFINDNLSETLNLMGINVFAQNKETLEIISSKALSKKLIHKEKIKTPKFQIFEKSQMALEFVRNLENPVAIKPDNHSYRECTQFAETYSQASKIIEKLFLNGNKKILIEDYVEGKNISLWVLTDGYNYQIIGESLKYQNDIAYFYPRSIDDELRNEIFNNVILPVCSALSIKEKDYIGVLGFDFILDNNKEIYLVGLNSFFDDINVDFFTQGFDCDWASIFESIVDGNGFENFEIFPRDEFMLTIRQIENGEEKIKFISANTKRNLELYLDELGYDIEEYKQACKLWKN